jgi:hypothetical protein
MDDLPPPTPPSFQTTGSVSQKAASTPNRLGSLKSFTSNSSIGSQVSTVGPLLGSSSLNEPHPLNTIPSSSRRHSNSSTNSNGGGSPGSVTGSATTAPLPPVRRLSSSSNLSTHSSHQQAIEALTVRRFSSSDASTSEPQGLSAEEALMVNKLRKASNRTGAFFRLNTINSSEYGSNPGTPKVTGRHIHRDR